MKQLFIALIISLSFCFTVMASDSDIEVDQVEQIDCNEVVTAPDWDVLKEERSYNDSGCAKHTIAKQTGTSSGDIYVAMPREVGWRSLTWLMR